MGAITPGERAGVMKLSPLKGVYDQTVDAVTAYEILRERAAAEPETPSRRGGGRKAQRRTWGEPPAPRPRPATRAASRQTIAEAATKSAVRSIASSLGRALVRGVLGSLLKR
jgi:hypothetical protein